MALQQKNKLLSTINKALQKAQRTGDLAQFTLPEVELEVPREKNHGDFASNIALVCAGRAKKAPREVAEIIVRHLPKESFLREVQIAGPGFLNFFLSNEWLYEVLREVESQGLSYGDYPGRKDEKILLEFVSANPVGPMNVVNARAAAVGDTLARLLRAVGYTVGTEFYVNDAGNQADIFGRSLEARYQQLYDSKYPFPKEGYPGDYVRDLALILKEERPDLKGLPAAERLAFCKRWGTDQIVARQKADLKKYGVEFDLWFRERDLHKAGALEKAIADLKEKGFLFSRDNALWFKSTTFGDDKDRVIIKSDGAYTYITADIAYHGDKLKRGFTRLINIWGPDHHGYIDRLKAAVQALGYPKETLEVLILQYVALMRQGELVKMSKRAGEFITMRELVDEVGKDAARFFFLNRSPESHLDFDLDLAVEESSDNPVYYVQYAHARIASVLRQADELGVPLPKSEETNLERLVEEEEIALLKHLALLPGEIVTAATWRAPQRITQYALELASLFHSFYNHCHILGQEEELRKARLVLVQGVQIVLQKVLATLLGIEAPEQM